MKSKLWNGGFLRTVLQGLAVTCAALLALSALGAGLTLGGVIGQQQLSAAAVVISFLGVFPGAWLTARHAAAALGGITGSTQRKPARRRRR